MRQVYQKLKNSILNPVLILYFMLIVSYFSQIRFLYEYIGILRKAVLIWGGVLLVYSVLKKFQIYKNKYAFTLLLFCINNGISVVVNYSNRFFYGIVTMAYVSLFLLIFFNATRWNDDIKAKKERIVNNILHINIFLSFASTAAALVMYVLNIKGKYKSGGNLIYYGMRENRLWGIFNSNTTATLCIISIVCSLIQLKSGKRRRFLITNIVMQTICLILTQSRTGWILIMVFAILYLFFQWVLPSLKLKEGIRKKYLSIVCSVAVMVGMSILPTVAKPILVQVPRGVIYVVKALSPGISEKLDSDVSLDRIDEDFLEEQDVTNGRVELWTAGLKIVKDHPIFGIGSENIIGEAEQYLSEDRYENLEKGGFHNSYLAILVASGVVGFLIFVIFLLMLVIEGLKYLWKKEDYKFSLIIMLLFTLMVNELMEARWLYNTSYLNIIFWVLVGLVIEEIGGIRKNDKQTCISNHSPS